MMKKILISALFVALTTTTMAIGPKLLQFGIKAGATIPTQSNLVPNLSDFKLSQDTQFGYHVGLQTRLNLMAFYIQPELVFNSNRYDLTVNNIGGAIGDPAKTAKVHQYNFDVPVMVGAKFLIFRFNAGPVFNLMSDVSISKDSGIKEVKFTRPSVGYVVGVGADILKLTLDFRYQGNLKKVDETVIAGDKFETFKASNNAWVLSAGLMF